MKNQFSNRRSQGSPLFVALMFAILISVAFFGFDTLTGGLVRSYARTVGTLAWTAAAGTFTTIDESGVLKTKRAIERENVALKQEIALYQEQNARYRSLEEENLALREMAALRESEGMGITAHVLSSFHASPYGTFLLGAGKSEGVSLGDTVLTPGGFVLGVVSDVDSHTATVQALFAPGNDTDLLAGSVAFQATGRGGGNARAEVPRDAKIEKGAAVTIPLYHGRVAGMIGEIEAASSSATQTLFIRIPVNLDALTVVLVIPSAK